MKVLFLCCLLIIFSGLLPSYGRGDASAQTAYPPGHTMRGNITLMDAVRNTLQRQPGIQIQEREVDVKTGALQEATGKFDWTVGAKIYDDYTVTPLLKKEKTSLKNARTTTELNRLSGEAGVQKQFRSGITVYPNVQVVQDRNPNVADSTAASRANVNLKVTFPLLKGRGEESVAANEKAAAINVESSRFDLQATLSKAVQDVVVAYWGYRAAMDRLDIQKAAETQARELLEDYAKLVKGDEKPAAEMEQLKANLAEKVTNRIQAGYEVVAAQQNLWVVMGLRFNKQAGDFPMDQLPRPELGSKGEWLADEEGYVGMALERRPDLLSLKKKVESATVLAKAAELDKRPQLDFFVQGGYSGLREGGAVYEAGGSLYSTVEGPNGQAGLQYQFPIENNSASGVFVQRRAQRSQAVLQATDLENNISANVISVLEVLRDYFSAWKEAQVSVTSYETAARNEEKKMRMGFSTVIDVITTYDRLRTAMLTENQLREGFAKGIVQLRYETGTIFPEREGGTQSLDEEMLMSVPAR